MEALEYLGVVLTISGGLGVVVHSLDHLIPVLDEQEVVLVVLLPGGLQEGYFAIESGQLGVVHGCI